MNGNWENLDVEALLTRRDEETTSANAGGFAVPLGRPLRRAFPTVADGYTKVKHPYVPNHESVESSGSGDADYEWARNLLK